MKNNETKRWYFDLILIACVTCLLVYIYFDSVEINFGIKNTNINYRVKNLFISLIYILYAVSFFWFIKRRIANKKNAFIVSLVISTIPIIFIGIAEKKRINKSKDEYGQIIIPAIVYDKVASSRGGQAGLYVYYYYKGVKETTRVGMNNKKPSFNSIHKGDTVLIMYAVEYRHWNHLYRLHPTPEELNRCRSGCFYFNKQIQDTIPNLPDDPFKLKW